MHQNHIPLIHKSHAIHSYYWTHWTSGIVHWWWCLSPPIDSCHLSVSLMANIPTMITAAVFSVVFVWLLRPTWFAQRCFDRHWLRLHGWFMFHKCTGPCHCCQLCKTFRLYNVSNKTVCRSLVVIDFQTLFNYWYSVPLLQRSAHTAVQLICRATLVNAALY
jgi:hypothetical protein